MKVDMDDETLKVYGYIITSSHRTKVVKALADVDVEIPSQIAKDAEIIPNYISKILNQLKDVGVVECMNEEARKGRLYRLTDLGKEIAKNL